MYEDSIERNEYWKKMGISFSPEGAGTDRIADLDVMNPATDFNYVAETYQKSKFIVVDDFLNPEVIARLRQFALITNVRHANYAEYGAIDFAKDALWFPLLSNISHDMAAAMPGIFNNHPFRRAWAFIHNNTGKGCGLHADPAAVNVNLWVTPDEFCVDKDRNGLVVWNKQPPADWPHGKYNAGGFECREYLANENANPSQVPYKCNRAIIFDSGYFHETDGVGFSGGYEGRRINYTFLYK